MPIFYDYSEIAIDNAKNYKKGKQNKRSEKLTNLIFLKVVSKIRDHFSANHFTS